MASDTLEPVIYTIGAYDLLRKIAEGGAGSVYKGRHRDSGQIVAIKIVPPHLADNRVLLKRFEQEFRAASRLDHPNLVRALDYCGATQTSLPFLVMEYVEGESLGQRLERDGQMAEEEAVPLLVQICQGLHLAHRQGMVHRDVKPDNILVTRDGRAKLCDLGLVKDLEAEAGLTRTGRGLGTPHFMAPEQFRNAKNADVRCDIYSLGATLYMMVTAELPFQGSGPLEAWTKKVNNDIKPARQLVPNLSERVDWAIRRAMSPDPALRPASCQEFVTDLIGQNTQWIDTPNLSQPELDVWYVEYQDEQGRLCTAVGSTQDMRRSLRDGLLGDARKARAGRTKSGPYKLLANYPEFHDFEDEPLALPALLEVTALPEDWPAPPWSPAEPQTPALPAERLPIAATSQAKTEPPAPPQVPGAPVHDDKIMSYFHFKGGRPSVPDPLPVPTRRLEWLPWLVMFGLGVVAALLAGHYLFPGK